MTGGLVQIAVYGTQDIILTGTPQITFFKLVYRRHTNFAIEPIRQIFEGYADFDRNLTSQIDKIGDLINKMYLEIDIPQVNLIKPPNQNILTPQVAQLEYEKSFNLYIQVTKYLAADTEVIRHLNLLLNLNNVSMTDIITAMNSNIVVGNLISERNSLILYIKTYLKDILTLKDKEDELLYQINRVDIKIMFDSIINTYLDPQHQRTKLKNIMYGTLFRELNDFNNTFNQDKLVKENINNQFLNGTYTESYKFAWVEELGNSFIEEIEVTIGGHSIDKHIGEWMSVWSKLTIHPFQRKNYDQMIGNVPELFTYDSREKPAYKLIIPLFFWFCKMPGLSLPLVALRYNDVLINLKLRSLRELAYAEDLNNLFGFDNIQNIYNVKIQDIGLYVDYIFLDSPERKRFAQSTHEYLIEQVQFNVFDNIVSHSENFKLTFSNPCKEFIWIIQPNQRLINTDGTTKCQWTNYGINDNGIGNPMKVASIDLNSHQRISKKEYQYFNYLQPYQHHTSSVKDGLNVFSIALYPEEHQPSSSLNLSRINNCNLNIKFNDDYLKVVNSNTDSGIVTGSRILVFTVNYNVLRFMGGIGGLAFQLS